MTDNIGVFAIFVICHKKKIDLFIGHGKIFLRSWPCKFDSRSRTNTQNDSTSFTPHLYSAMHWYILRDKMSHRSFKRCARELYIRSQPRACWQTWITPSVISWNYVPNRHDSCLLIIAYNPSHHILVSSSGRYIWTKVLLYMVKMTENTGKNTTRTAFESQNIL